MRTAVILVALAACIAPGDEQQRFVLQGDDVQVSTTQLEFPAETHAEFAEANAGDLVAGTQQGGYIRRVIDVSEKNGIYQVSTEDVPLAEAVGDADSPNRLAEDGKADGDSEGMILGLVMDDKAIYADGTFSIDVTKARLSFSPTLDVDLRVGGSQLEHFLIKAAGRLEAELAVHVKGTARGAVEVAKPFWSAEKTFVQWVGWVPVVEVAELTVGIGVEVEADGAFDARVDAGFKSNVTAGVEYTGSAWRNVGGAYVTRTGSPVVASGSSEVGISTFVYAEIAVRLYGVAGPFIEIKPNIRLTRGADGRWERTVGVVGEAGAELALPFGDESLLRYAGKIFDLSYPL